MLIGQRQEFWRLGSWRLLSALALSAILVGVPASAEPGNNVDAVVDRNATRDAARDAVRAGERVVRDEIRAAEDRARADSRAAEASARADFDAARQAARAAEDAARAQADAQEEAQKAAEDAAKAAADAAEDAAKAAEDAAKAAEDAARDAQRAAEDAAEAGSSGSAGGENGVAAMRDLAAEETPEIDRDGFPVRRGELLALDLGSRARMAAEARGFRVIDVTRLPSLDSSMTRLAVPAGMTAADAVALLRHIDAGGSYDLAHYYGEQIGVAGRDDGPEAAADDSPVRFARVTMQIVPRLRVGMIDTGVASHPALRGLRLVHQDFGDRSPVVDHGTAVASVLANDGVAEVLSASVFRGNNARRFTSPEAIVRALAWLVQQNVPVINISLAGPRNDVLDRLIGRAQNAGFLIVAAAGNGGPAAPPAYPAALDGVIAVTAVDARGRIYRHANQGDYVRYAALAVAVPVATVDGRTAPSTGTSFAAPHVAALLGRCATRVRPANQNCIAALDRLAVDLGVPGRDPVYGIGAIP